MPLPDPLNPWLLVAKIFASRSICMFRLLTTTALALIATPLLAEDFHAPAPITAVTVYPEGAKVTQVATVDLPAGDHRILLPLSDISDWKLPDVTVPEGVTLGAISYVYGQGLDPKQLLTPVQAEALARIEVMEDAVQAQGDKIAAARAHLSALENRLGFVTAIRPPAEGADAESLIATAELVQAQTVQVATEIEAAKQALRPLTDEITTLQGDLTAARAIFEALNPPGTEADLLAIDVSTAGPVQGQVSLEGYTSAGWVPQYDLNHHADGGLTLERKAAISLDGKTPWHDVAVTLSTIMPTGRVAPWDLYADRARIREPRPPEPVLSRSAEGMVDPVIEPELVIVEASMAATIDFDGVAPVYTYPRPVTLEAGSVVTLTLDTLTLPTTTEIHAVPKRDNTAFLMARVTNDTGEPLLPGDVSIYREGTYIGDTELELIPAGAEATLPLGPIEGLRLDHTVARNQTGDTGILTRANTRSQEMWFTVTNLTGEAQELTAFYPLPFSEQEDLTITLDVSPRPDRSDVEDKRGVSAWDMTLAPGEERQVRIRAEFDWPDGWELNWNP
jgi:uncharacterized protein (TIGR02231 family)